MKRRRLFCIVLCQLIAVALVSTWHSGSLAAQEKEQAAQAKPDKPVRMLFVTQSGGFRHGSVTRKGDKLSPAEEAMTQLGLKTNLFRVDCTQDVVQDFTKENLDNYDIVMFYTTGGRKQLPIAEEDLQYFLNTWLKQKGRGFIGAHSAADTYADYEPYWDMLGGSFNGHPWGSGERVTVTVHDTEHPISKPWGSEFEIQDEIYRFKNWQPEKVRVLMSLNMAKTRRKEPYHVPIAWCKEYGDGKMFHMSLGHNEHVWENERYMQSMLGGIKWILGMEKGDSAPNPQLSKAEEEKAKAVVRNAEASK
jgi:type 1 glutamine amidotransferase